MTVEDLGLSKLKSARRKKVQISSENLVDFSQVRPGQVLPLVVRPAVAGLDLTRWARDHRDRIEKLLEEHGGILLRGFGLSAAEQLGRFIADVYGEALEYRDRVQPRTQVREKIYSSTEYPPDQVIEMHNESSYAATWPLKIFFLCLLPAESGGETPLADVRRVLARVEPEVRERFERRGVMYLRNLGEGFGISWQTAYQTEDRAEMEEFCRRTGTVVEWKESGGVRTKSVRPVVVRHPRTGEKVWFNAALSSHVSTVEPSVRELLLAEYDEQDLPKQTFYGDGTSIEPETLAAVRRAFREETVTFPWERGDLLILDNMLAAHGRQPYTGPRQVVVGMAEPVSVEEV